MKFNPIVDQYYLQYFKDGKVDVEKITRNVTQIPPNVLTRLNFYILLEQQEKIDTIFNSEDFKEKIWDGEKWVTKYDEKAAQKIINQYIANSAKTKPEPKKPGRKKAEKVKEEPK